MIPPMGDFEIGRILHLRSEIRNIELDLAWSFRESDLPFRISDLRCRIRPISRSYDPGPGYGERFGKGSFPGPRPASRSLESARAPLPDPSRDSRNHTSRGRCRNIRSQI